MKGWSGDRGASEWFYERMNSLVLAPTSIMEVCGTHTMAVSRFGLRSRMPDGLRLIAGPGCPVCVTPCEQIDQVIAMVREPGVAVACFGDMMRVPASTSSLERERAAGREVHTVYSPMDGLQLAMKKPHRLFVFFGIGFETTSPSVAATLIQAAALGVRNFLVLPAFKLVPPAMAALAANGQARIDGFLCPGHVSALIGCAPYEPLATDSGVPCVIAGFEALDILEGVTMLLSQIAGGRSEVEVEYRRAVPSEGNPTALGLAERVFRRCDSHWRGIGLIPDSGLELNEEFAEFDALSRVEVNLPPAPDLPEGCSCGKVMRGLLSPPECPLFATACSPPHPVGPCMVSSEGACSAYLRYGD